MKFVEQSADIMPPYDDPIKHIERCGRIAYKSEDKITEDSANKFVQMLVKRGHLSVIEHANVSFWVEKYNLFQLKDYTLNKDTKFLYINPQTNIVSGNYRALFELIAKYPIKFIDLCAKLNEIAPIVFENSYQQLPDHIRKHTTPKSFIIATNKDIKYQDKPYTTYHSVHFVTSRGISHELVRHRPCAFCLSGDTKILRYNQKRGHLTILELFKRQQNSQMRGRNKLITLRSMTPNKIIVPNHFVKILYSGTKEVYRIKTSLNYEIKVSKDHIFFTPNGPKKLKELNIGNKVLINGKQTIGIEQEWLKYQYHYLSKPIATIAKEINCSYATVRKYIQKYNLQKPMGSKPQDFIPWNKNLTENQDPRVKNQANALRKHHHKNGKQAQNSNWKGQNIKESAKRKRLRSLQKEKCFFCGKTNNLHNHHIDNDINNWDPSNKLTLCQNCHKLLHHGYNYKHVIPDTIVSIEYIGPEETYDIEMAEPYHNFIANGFVVHNSQESTRYCNYKNQDIQFIKQDFNNQFQTDIYEASCSSSERHYKTMIDQGTPPQIARDVLNHGLKTELIVTANLAEWHHILKLRCSKQAHPQMQALMKPLLFQFQTIYPDFFDDLKSY